MYKLDPAIGLETSDRKSDHGKLQPNIKKVKPHLYLPISLISVFSTSHFAPSTENPT